MNDQIVALNSRMNKLEESIGPKLSTELDSKLESIRDTQAETGADIDKIRGEIQELSGRVGDNRRLVKHTIERDTSDQDTVKARLSELTQRITELELRHKQVQEYLGLKVSGDQQEQYVKKGPAEPKEPLKKPPVVEERPALSESQLYEETLVIYKQGQYDQALVGFKSFIEKYPKSELADNAQFWVGECYMGLKQYEQAILAYQEVIKEYPKGNKVPNAMLRQAFAFHEINDKVSSKLLLKKIIKKYPDSSEAKIASAKLKTLK
ncbi:MAG: tol-pal system protein YbgF [Desulfobacteraceae bacterium]|nr:MAG: tol-pal system protein YbgF [Desulfobacteraceae bacterium]